MGKVPVAVIGAGAMANRAHHPALASLADVDVAAICDVDPARLQATEDRQQVAGRYADYRRMVEATAPDAVYAIGPVEQMYPVWVWCLRQGLSLYSEEPMSMTVHQARVLAHGHPHRITPAPPGAPAVD